eukprot:COSAG02_NODE_5739_length_4077_cov_105.689416_2_plen_153_part_00
MSTSTTSDTLSSDQSLDVVALTRPTRSRPLTHACNLGQASAPTLARVRRHYVKLVSAPWHNILMHQSSACRINARPTDLLYASGHHLKPVDTGSTYHRRARRCGSTYHRRARRCAACPSPPRHGHPPVAQCGHTRPRPVHRPPSHPRIVLSH